MELSEAIRQVKNHKPDHIKLVQGKYFVIPSSVELDEEGTPDKVCAACILGATKVFLKENWEWWNAVSSDYVWSSSFKYTFPVLMVRYSEFSENLLQEDFNFVRDVAVARGWRNLNNSLFSVITGCWDTEMDIDRILRIVEAAEAVS